MANPIAADMASSARYRTIDADSEAKATVRPAASRPAKAGHPVCHGLSIAGPMADDGRCECRAAAQREASGYAHGFSHHCELTGRRNAPPDVRLPEAIHIAARTGLLRRFAPRNDDK